MQMVTGPEITQALDYTELIAHLRMVFAGGSAAPRRHSHAIPVPESPTATLLLMPYWRAGCSIGVKIVTVFPGNPKKGLASIQGVYVLMDGESGLPKAVMDAAELTARRTAAASALASEILSRSDSAELLMVGAGTLAPQLVEAHCGVRQIRRVLLWNRHPEKAESLRERLVENLAGIQALVVTDLAAAAARADIISCATPSREPLIRGDWLSPGCHLDLVGGFTPSMREVDDSAIRRSRLFVDTWEGALSEAGDLVSPLSRGVVGRDQVEADLHHLCRSGLGAPRAATDITLFKSVGTALEDLAAAELVLRKLEAGQVRGSK